MRHTSLVSLLSLQKNNNILSRKSLSCSRPLWIHYLGEMMALKVKLTFHPTLLSLRGHLLRHWVPPRLDAV
jgi:hypothetical protein